MLAVLEVARSVFWNDSMYNRELMPSEASLEMCRLTLVDLATMSGRERIATFQQCGVDPSLFPLFLRSLQHITEAHNSGNYADDAYLLHRRLSPKFWSAQAYTVPLLGYPSVNSRPYRDKCAAPVTTESKPVETFAPIKPVSSSDLHYNGLLNQGATCYLNSLLQALFHISTFRSTIYRMPTKEEADTLAGGDVVAVKSIPYALQRLFCLLQTGSKPVGTKELTESFGWSSTDSFIQHDVHEMTRVLLDKLEEKLNLQRAPNGGDPNDKSENEIHKLFHGCLESYVKVDEADYYGAREEPFYDIQLVVKNKRSIYESFDAMFQVEVLDGKNKYCLEQNGTKSYHRAEKGVRLKETPPVLLLHLTRYDYDIDLGETKVSTRWDYYNTLDLSRYMPHVPVEYTQYTLCSVLVHSGSSAGFGHYFCFLRCSGSWYKFNDETVSPATLKDVFGANFGGYRTNYWGAQVPHTASAYMLVYVRTTQISTILRRIDASDVPSHVVEQLRKEEAEHERLMQEKAEDHLYGRVHFIQPPEILEQEEYLSSKRPVSQKFPPHRTLRVLLEAEALPDFTAFASSQLGISAPEQAMWFVSHRERADASRLFAQVKPGMKVSDVLEGCTECCVLVTTSTNIPWINCVPKPEGELQIFHHKFYDPLELKVSVLGSTVVRRDPQGVVTDVLKQMDPVVRTMISQLPDDIQKLRGHHQQMKLVKAPVSMADLQKMVDTSAAIPDEAGAEKVCVHRYPSCDMNCLLEEERQTFSPCTELRSGDVIVWQLQTDTQNQDNVFYHNIESFQHFLRHRIPVEIRLNLPPKYPSLIATELAEDMTYEQLQRFVAYLIGESANYDRVRFTRHNPETELPYFMKGKKKDRPTLAKLLTPSTSRITTLSKYLYYEFCKFTVTEIENAHSLQFKLYNSAVKVVSPHWILMPRDVPITARELFTTCIREIQQDILSGEVHPRGASDPSDPAAAEHPTSTDLTVQLFLNADAETWRSLRLVDVWRGRVYNVLDAEHDLSFENQTFEESAEYRIEQVPLPLADVSRDDQSLYQVQHFTMVRQRRDAVETHSEPFSMYVDHNELPQALLRRVADKLGLSYMAVQDWKVCLVQENQVTQVDANLPMGKQIMEFRQYESFCPNKEPQKMAFIGLEHAPVAKRTAKHADKVVILN